MYPRRVKAARLAYAVNRIEGVPVTENAHQLSAMWMRGDISGDMMKTALLAKHQREPKD